MFRPTSIRLTALLILLLALTLAALRQSRVVRVSSPSAPADRLVTSEITVPVEIIETGEDPAMLEVRVQP